MTKKANGVYYTPAPVVDYIVRGTLGPLLEGKSPMQLGGRTDSGTRDPRLHPLTVLDPACGVGCFLLGVYQFLLDWSLRWYCEHDSETWLTGPNATICRGERSLRLRNDERKRILFDHVFGVDIDEPALEIARHSLLRMMCGDQVAQRNAARQLTIACSTNIRRGDSLIGSDFRNPSPAGSLRDAHPVVRPFDWEAEFPALRTSQGFDAIVGNPPYVNARVVKQHQGDAVKRYYREHYRCAHRAFDLYVLFVERANALLRHGGRAGLIVPNKLATLEYARPCRQLLLEQTTLDTIMDVSTQQLFPDASVYPYIVTWTKQPPAPDHRVRIVSVEGAADLLRVDASRFVHQAAWSADAGFTIHETLEVESRVATQRLSQRGSLHSGTTGFSAERMANELRERDAITTADHVFDFIVSGNIDRYAISTGNVRFMKRLFRQPVLAINSKILTKDKRELFSQSKIVIAGMSRHLEAAFDPGGLALGVQVYAVANFHDDPRFLLGLVNSRLMTFLMRTRFQAKHLAGGYLAMNKAQLATLPIRIIDENDREAVRMRDRIIQLVDGIHQANAASEGEIDHLVDQLYALTEDEIDTVQQVIGR